MKTNNNGNIYLPISEPENECSDVGTEHNHYSVHDDETGEETEEEKPEPDKNIYFLIY